VSSVKPYVALLRQVPDDLLPPVFSATATHDPEQAFSVRRLIWLALSRPEKQSPEHTEELSRVCILHPEVASALTLAQAFVKMLRERDVDALPTWLAEAQASSIREFRQFAKSASSEIARRWKRL
jgi:transposase